MKFGSLFTGIGCFYLGFERAGMECAWQVEIDKDCQRVLAAKFPNAERLEDVTKVERLAAVYFICGGFPCQDLSVAGKRAGLAGERSGLWFEFLRIIGINKPRWIVIENVPGLLSSDEGRDFAVILRGLVECGYCLAWRVVDAQFYGVAQRRRRVFIVGSLGDGSSAEILFESESVSWNPPTRGEAGPGVTPILEAGARTNGDGCRDGDGIGVEGDPMFTLQRGKQHAIAATLDQRGRGPTDAVMMNLQVSMPLKGKANSSHDESHETYVTHALRSEGADASEDGTGRGTPLIVAFDERNITSKENRSNPQPGDPCHTLHADPPTLIAFSSKDHGADAGEIAPTLRSQNFKDSHMNGGGQAAIAFGWNKSDSQTMRVDEETTDALQSSPQSNPAIAFSAGQGSKARSVAASVEHSPPLKAAESGTNKVPSVSGNFGVRRLTPRECERLQGFPDDWTLYDAEGKVISDSARYRMLGNAVAVPVANCIGKRIVMVFAQSYTHLKNS